MKSLKRVILLALLGCVIALPIFAGGGKEAKEEKMKLAVTGVVHPYFQPMEQAVKDWSSDTGIEAVYRATQHFDQEESNVLVEGLVAKGFNGFGMWPGHPVSVNATVSELVEQGIPVAMVAAPSERPTESSFCIATDVKASAMEATENVIEAMGGQGNLVNLLGALTDPNTILRKEGVEEVAAKYPGVEIVAEIGNIDALEAATSKIDALLGAREDEIDGMVATAYVPTVVAAEALTQIGDKRIKFVGIDDDPKVLQAIRDGFVTGTMSQAPYAQAYVALEGIRLLKSGYKMKEGVWFIDSGSFLINEENVDTYKEIIQKNAKDMQENFADKYLEKAE